MNNQYRLERAAPGDAAEIMALYRGLIGTPGCTWDEYYPDEDIVLSDIARGAQYALRDGEGRIVGVASESDDDFSALRWTPRKPCVLARIGVLKEMRGHGLGTLLMERVIGDVKQRGFDGVIMLVSKGNAAALALYKKLGFVCCGEVYLFEHDFYRYELVFR